MFKKQLFLKKKLKVLEKYFECSHRMWEKKVTDVRNILLADLNGYLWVPEFTLQHYMPAHNRTDPKRKKNLFKDPLRAREMTQQHNWNHLCVRHWIRSLAWQKKKKNTWGYSQTKIAGTCVLYSETLNSIPQNDMVLSGTIRCSPSGT